LAAEIYNRCGYSPDILEEEFKDKAYAYPNNPPDLYQQCRAFYRQLQREESRLRQSALPLVINDSGLWMIVFYIHAMLNSPEHTKRDGQEYLLFKHLSEQGGLAQFINACRLIDGEYRTLNIIFDPIPRPSPNVPGRWHKSDPDPEFINEFRKFILNSGAAIHAEFVNLASIGTPSFSDNGNGRTNNDVKREQFNLIVKGIVDRYVIPSTPASVVIDTNSNFNVAREANSNFNVARDTNSNFNARASNLAPDAFAR